MKLTIEGRALSSLTVGRSSRAAYVDVGFNDFGLAGSSIRGAMRSAISWAISNGLVQGYNSCGEIEPQRIELAHKDMTGKGLRCDVCEVFGYPNHEGLIRVGAAEIADNRKWVLTRVSIDDRTLKAREGFLFKQEVLPPLTGFKFEVELPSSMDCGLVRLVLLSVYYLRLWRIGMGGMVDLRLSSAQGIPCEAELQDVLKQLGDWLWQ